MFGGGIAAWCFILTAALVDPWRDKRYRARDDRALCDCDGVLLHRRALRLLDLQPRHDALCARPQRADDHVGRHPPVGADVTDRAAGARARASARRTSPASAGWGITSAGPRLKAASAQRSFYSTHRTPDDLLYVVTANGSYAISVEDEVAFAEAVQAQQRLGSLVSVAAGAGPAVPGGAAVLGGPRGAGAGAWRHSACSSRCSPTSTASIPTCRTSIALPFPQLSGVTRIGSKSELLKLPAAGIILLLDQPRHRLRRALVGAHGRLRAADRRDQRRSDPAGRRDHRAALNWVREVGSQTSEAARGCVVFV